MIWIDVVLAVFVVGLVSILRVYRAFWHGRNQATFERVWRWYWVWGDAALQGWLRAGVALYVAGWAMVIGIAFARLSQVTSGTISTIMLRVGFVWFLLWVLFAVFAIAIAIWNRPRFLVPPSMRGQPGLIATWRDGRAKRRRPRD